MTSPQPPGWSDQQGRSPLTSARHQASQVPVPVTERFRQLTRAGELMLHPFTLAEIGAVLLDPDAVWPEERGAFLQQVPPGQTSPSSAGAVASLARLGFVRPEWPGRPGTATADELAGWCADPAAGPDGRAPVTLSGDLAIITRLRAQPVWLAEVAVSTEPGRPEPESTRWRLVARLYAPFRPPVRLVERPARADGTLPPFALVREDRALVAILGLCGADMPGYRDSAPPSVATPGAPTENLAADFRSIAQLRVAHADGTQVLLRSLVVASAGIRSWLLEGHQWEWATEISVAELADRVSSVLTRPGDAHAAGG